jgi:hypothetical protein
MNKTNEKYFEHKVEWYKQLFTLFFAVNVGCIAWLIANYTKVIKELVILDILTISVILSVLGLINFKVRNYMKRLREK